MEFGLRLYTFFYCFWGAHISLQISLSLERSFNTRCVIGLQPVCQLQKQVSFSPHGLPLPSSFSIPLFLAISPFHEFRTWKEKLSAKKARTFLAKTIKQSGQHVRAPVCVMSSMCAYVGVCVSMCASAVYLYVYMYTCIYLWMYVCKYMYISVPVCIHVHVYKCVKKICVYRNPCG